MSQAKNPGLAVLARPNGAARIGYNGQSTASALGVRKQYASSVAAMVATSYPVGTLVETAAYLDGGTKGGNTYEIVPGGTGTPDGGRFIDLADGQQARGKFENLVALPEQFGAVGDGVADDAGALQAALNSGYFVVLASIYGTSQELTVPSMARLGGLGDTTGIKWVGAAPVAVPDKTGGTAVLRFAAADPSVTALASVFAGSFKIDCAFTDNLMGTAWIYCSVQSRGEFIAVRDLGANGIGHYFSKLWYASFEGLSVRGGGAGSVGFMLSAFHNQINGIPFRNLQTGNGVDTALVLDTSDGYHYQNEVTGTLESGVTGVRHVGGYGVRQSKMALYFEGFTGATIDWTTPVSPLDRTGAVLWENCNFFSGAVVNLAEGQHKFVAAGPIGTVNASGNASVMLDGLNASTAISITDSAEVRRHSQVARRTCGNAYAAENTDPMVGKSQSAPLAAGVASATFDIPGNLLKPLPAGGGVLRVTITARRNYAGVERTWDGWLTRNSGGTWVLTELPASSAPDSVWGVTVNAGTGAITVQFDASDAKTVTLTHAPV